MGGAAVTPRTTFVVGLGRCGSSAMMAMLAAAGLPVFCDPDQVGNGWENERALLRPHGEWLAEAQGMAVKVLAPQCFELPPAAGRFIVMHRAAPDQAASQLTAMRALKIKGRPDADQTLLAYYRDATPGLLAHFRDGLQVGFAELVGNPIETAWRVQQLIGTGLPAQMADAIWQRPAYHDGTFRDRRNHHTHLVELEA